MRAGGRTGGAAAPVLSQAIFAATMETAWDAVRSTPPTERPVAVSVTMKGAGWLTLNMGDLPFSRAHGDRSAARGLMRAIDVLGRALEVTRGARIFFQGPPIASAALSLPAASLPF